MLFCKLVEKEFFVEGIHCEKCKGNVEKALKSIEGVKKVVVDLKVGNEFKIRNDLVILH